MIVTTDGWSLNEWFWLYCAAMWFILIVIALLSKWLD